MLANVAPHMANGRRGMVREFVLGSWLMTELVWQIVGTPKLLSVHVPTMTPSFLAPPDSAQNTTLGRLLSMHVPTTTPFQTPVHTCADKASFPCSHRDPNSAAPPPRTNSPSANANDNHSQSLRYISSHHGEGPWRESSRCPSLIGLRPHPTGVEPWPLQGDPIFSTWPCGLARAEQEGLP